MIVKTLYRLALISLIMNACNATNGIPTASPSPIPANTSTSLPSTETRTPPPSLTATPIPSLATTSTPEPTATISPTPRPVVERLNARVTAGLLSCRYGPGPEYLYLFALRQGANIELVGRVDAENWNWVWVENQTRCWVNAQFLEVEGDIKSLPVIYPGTAKLPITPYYPPSAVLSAERNKATHEIAISWVHVPISPGDFEDDTMQTYIVEIWRCVGGELIFDPLATSLAFITFIDEPGCSEPSHGQVWVQEKHGYAGPAEIPWPEY
ncbi:MAG TPA: hypothetical protein VJ821_02460 [Anaerolineales bacterium]|nr:hypothetical protein [Anaerolineales bacterium]